MIYTFHRFVCDTQAATLRRDGMEREIEPEVFRLLAYLLAHRERIVSKTELLDNVWPENTLSPDGLTRQVRAARLAVDDDGYRQESIETVRGQGYRFIAPVTEQAAQAPGVGGAAVPVSEAAEASAATPSAEPIRRAMRLSRQYYQAGVGILTYVGTVLPLRHPASPLTVRLEQESGTVRLLVEAPATIRAALERDLELYGLVVAENMAPEEFLPDALAAQALRHKLELIHHELRLTRAQLLAEQRSGKRQHERITSLGTDLAEFRQLMAQALRPGAA